MNKMVSVYEVGGLSLKIKDAETDIPLGVISSTTWTQDATDPIVYFNLGSTRSASSVASKLEIGKYYKIQVAYTDENNYVGYYSTISIIKYTSKPTVSIATYSRYRTNVDNVQYTGVYHNYNDTTEKVYQYKFTLCDSSGTVLDSSGWRIHNANTDTEQGQSLDQYNILYSIQPDQKYTMQYSIITNNGLEVNSPRYQLVGTTSVQPELSATLYVESDYDNGCVSLWLEKNFQRVLNRATGEMTTEALNGSFVISRSSAAENFVIWTKLHTFYLSGLLPEGAIFNDYTVEHGQTYRYAIQQFNEHGIYSSKIYAKEVVRDEDDNMVKTHNTDIVTDFEYMFLYDGERQLKVRFNPKVSSFKTVLQDAKKTTLGSKYPFFFRSGVTEYKEFPVAGLISYMIDENEYFMSRTGDLLMPADWQDTTDIIDENLKYERQFKLKVLNWLNDGNIKLFRSPAEGNYLVRLMNVQLTPIDSVSRMIHNFSCQATEVDDCTPQKLSEYGFLHADIEVPKQLRFGTILLADYIDKIIQKSSSEAAALEYVKGVDLLGSFACQYLKIEDCWPQTAYQLGGEDYYVGSTGSYEASFTDNPRGLYLLNPSKNMPGSITYGVLTTISNSFDTVTKMRQEDVIDFPQGYANNYITDHQNKKEIINKIYFAHFYLNDMIYDVTSIENLIQQYGMYMDTEHEEQYHDDTIYDDETERAENPIQQYKVYMQGTITDAEMNRLKNQNIEVYRYLTEYYHLVQNEETGDWEYEYLQKNATDLFIDGTLFRTGKSDKYQQGTHEYWDKGGDLYKFTVHTLGGVRGVYGTFDLVGRDSDAIGPTKVYIDNDIIDIALTGDAYLPVTDGIPNDMHWGSQVQATIAYQKLVITYGAESDELPEGPEYSNSLAEAFADLDNAHKYYDAQALQLVRHTVTPSYMSIIRDTLNENSQAFYIWEDGKFYRLADEEKLSFTGTEVWTCFSQWEYNPTLSYIIGGETFYGYCVIDKTKINTQDYSPAYGYETMKQQYLRRLELALAAREEELNLVNE